MSTTNGIIEADPSAACWVTRTATIDFNPAEMRTAQQKGACVIGGRVHHYVKHEVKRANARLQQAILSSALGDLPPVAEVPVRVEIVYWYAARNVPVSQRGALRTKRPDVDNLCKGLLDCITQCGVAWADDAQVASLRAEKRYLAHRDQQPRICISVAYPAGAVAPEHTHARNVLR
ncbi:MAG: RusA family crossover junction endodeoxyribonuclease [Candidatus Spyradenecus sp.]